MFNTRRLWLIALAVAVIATDAGLTLAGQSSDYWAGDYAAAIEGNPLARPFLAHSPAAFVALVAGWALTVALVVGLWRHWAANWVAAFVTFTHAIGGGSWLVVLWPWGWAVAVAYLAAVAVAARWAWRRAGREV